MRVTRARASHTRTKTSQTGLLHTHKDKPNRLVSCTINLYSFILLLFQNKVIILLN